MPSTVTIITSTVALSAVGYLIYFDYQRRNSVDFRKNLKKSIKKYQKEQEVAAEQGKNELRNKIGKIISDSLENDPLPENLAEREKFFVSEVSRADELLGQGEHVDAALAFYRALRVYPSPIDLLNIYDKSLKPEVLEILRTMIVIEPPAAIASVLSGAATSAAEGVDVE